MKINWGTAILIFLIIFLALAAIFIVFSFKHNNDLMSEDYYEQGATYSNKIEISKRSTIYADSISINSNDTITVINVCKSIIQGVDSIHIYFFRPSDKKFDFQSTMVANSNLKIDNKHFVHGRYVVKLSWICNKNEYLVEKDYFVK